MIRTYQAEHGGMVFYAAPTRRQKTTRSRLAALMVIAAVAASVGVVQGFQDRSAAIAAGAYASPMP